jgi:hypothetical protein
MRQHDEMINNWRCRSENDTYLDQFGKTGICTYGLELALPNKENFKI